jgi:putative transposase
MRFRFIEDRRADHRVSLMCEVLGVSPAGYYAWRARPESRRSAANRALVDDIKRVHRDACGRYGSPRIHAELRAQGRGVSRGRIERLMRRHGIRAIMARPRRVRTTDSRHDLPIAANLIERNFSAPRRTRSGSPTSLMSRPTRAGSIWPPSWTFTAAGSSAGRCAIIYAPNCHWRP